MIHLQTLKNGFQLYGSTVETCEFVSGLSIGYMDKGVRKLSVLECTEALLLTIELSYDLIVS